MASVFVSHSSRDRTVTEQVVGRLRAAGFAALFVDFDPEQGIPTGRNWERELYAQLRRSDAVIFLASEASVASRWCSIEIGLARSLGRPVFPLRLQQGVALPLLADVQWTDLTDLTDPEPGMTRLLTGLRSAGLDPADSFAWNPARSPYPGLAPFAPEDAAVFFGRQPETHRLVELLTPTLQRGPGRMVAVVGPSGSGKSSLVRAGLLPRLARQPERWLVVPPLRPGRQPTANLAGSLARAFADHGHPRPVNELAAALERGPVGLVELAEELADLGAYGASRPGVLVIIDQAEELLTRTGAHEQQAFLQLLAGALHEDSPVWAVATLRSEFLSTAPDRAGLAEAVDDPLVIEPLSRARLAEVIVRPAQRAGLDLEPGLIERMVEDTAGGDALPLLGYTLHQLYQRAGRDGRITAADYEAVGGVIGALRHRADRLTDELRRRGLGELVLPTLTRLATVTGDEQPTRRRVRRSAFNCEEQAVVDAFVDAALLVSSQDPADPSANAVVEVAHEALLRQWPPLRDAIEADRDLLRLRSELERLAADWQHGQRDDSYLLRGGRLATINQRANEHPGELGPLEREFLEASWTLATYEIETIQRSNKRLRRLLTGVAALLVVALAAGGLAWQKNEQAQTQSRLASSRQLAVQADRLVDAQPDTAILAGLHSLSLAREQPPQPPAGLVSGLARFTHASRLLSGHSGPVNRVTFSPDGKLLATTSGDKSVRLWDVKAARLHGQPLKGHTGAVSGADFSPDGRLLATTSFDTTVRLWDVETGRPRSQPISGHTDWVWETVFSPDGQLLATASKDGTVRVWDVNSAQPYGSLHTGSGGTVWGLAFSPDGQLLATSSDEGTVHLWSTLTKQPTGPVLTTNQGVLYDVAFSPDGRLLATTGEDTTVRLWDVSSGQPHGQPFTGHTDVVYGVAFSPDGRLLASASEDETVRLWDASTGRPHGQPLTGHTDWVWGVEFSPDGQLIASGSGDQSVRLWNVLESYSVSQPLTGHTDIVNRVTFNPDGRLLATTGEDKTVRLWDVSSGLPQGQPLTGHTDGIWGLAFSPDGQLLATASKDKTVRLWNVATGQARRQPLTGHTETVYQVAFSPDGRLLATASRDQTVRLWDVATGQPHGRPLIGHSAEVYEVAFSPDGQLLATAGQDKTVRLWDALTGEPKGQPLAAHADTVWQVAFSPDGRLLASASQDGTVRLWEVTSGRLHGQPLSGHTDAVYGVEFSPDGQRLATAGGDQMARLWDLTFSSWVESGCKMVNRNLSLTEWNRLDVGLPYERACPGLPAGEGAPANASAAEY